jgi:Flp pilus assembly protein TadD
MEYLEKKSATDPANATFHNNIGWLCAAARRRLDDGLKHAQKAVELRPKDAGVLDTLAEVFFQRGEKKQAVAAIEKAIQLSPDRYYKDQLKRFAAGNTSTPIPGTPNR